MGSFSHSNATPDATFVVVCLVMVIWCGLILSLTRFLLNVDVDHILKFVRNSSLLHYFFDSLDQSCCVIITIGKFTVNIIRWWSIRCRRTSNAATTATTWFKFLFVVISMCFNCFHHVLMKKILEQSVIVDLCITFVIYSIHNIQSFILSLLGSLLFLFPISFTTDNSII